MQEDIMPEISKKKKGNQFRKRRHSNEYRKSLTLPS
jgi:hypothetical protein